MKLIDISRELLSASVYPGDPAPELKALSRMAWGDLYNGSALELCVHNGTHMDAPLHFIDEGADIAGVPLNVCVGECTVVACDGVLLGDRAEKMIDRLRRFDAEGEWFAKRPLAGGLVPRRGSAARYAEYVCERLLLKGTAAISPSAAFVLSDAGIRLLGTEGQSVSDGNTAEVHRQLLGSGMVLLEGLDLSRVEEGQYFLFAAPVKIAGSDGAPVRAILVER